MNQLKQVKACDRIFVISDTFNSNKKMMDHLDIDPDDIFSPNDPNVIPEITKRIEAERDDLLEATIKYETGKDPGVPSVKIVGSDPDIRVEHFMLS